MEQISFVSPASEASQYVCLVMVEDGGDPNHKIGIHGYNHHTIKNYWAEEIPINSFFVVDG